MKTILTSTVSVVALDAEQLSVDCVADHSAYTRFFTTARPALRHPAKPWPAPRAPLPPQVQRGPLLYTNISCASKEHLRAA